MSGLEHRRLDYVQHIDAQAVFAEINLRDLPQALGTARGADCSLPAGLAVALRQGRQCIPAGQSGFVVGGPIDHPLRKEALRQAHAAQRHRFEQIAAVVGAHDAFGRAAADVDDQALAAISRQGVGCAEVDQAGFLATGNHLDRKAQRVLGALQKGGRIAGDPEGVGGHRTHGVRLE